MPNPKDITPEELAYFAGIVDGEGSMTIARHSNRSSSPSPILRVSNTNPILMDWLKQNFGGSVSASQNKIPNRRLNYTWYVTGKKAIVLIEIVLPYLRLKSKQAGLMLSYWRIHQSWGIRHGIRPHWGYYTQVDAVAEAISILNQGGTVEDAKSKDGKA